MHIFSVESNPNRKYALLAPIEGGTVQSKHLGKDFMAGPKTIVGGELRGYTEMMQEARDIATQRMTDNAAKLGAEVIIGVCYAFSAIVQRAAEVIAYGAAIRYLD